MEGRGFRHLLARSAQARPGCGLPRGQRRLQPDSDGSEDRSTLRCHSRSRGRIARLTHQLRGLESKDTRGTQSGQCCPGARCGAAGEGSAKEEESAEEEIVTNESRLFQNPPACTACQKLRSSYPSANTDTPASLKETARDDFSGMLFSSSYQTTWLDPSVPW